MSVVLRFLFACLLGIAVSACSGGGDSTDTLGATSAAAENPSTETTTLNTSTTTDTSTTPATTPGTETTPVTPPVVAVNNAPTITGTAVTTAMVDESYSFTPAAADTDGDSLSFSITNQPSWASFSAVTGALTGTPAASDVGTHTNITITVNDSQGKNASLNPFQISIQPTLLEQALASGNAVLVSNNQQLLDATLSSIVSGKDLLLAAKSQLFNLNTDGSVKTDGTSLTGIDWYPTHDAALLTSTFGMNTNVLSTNSVFVEGKTVENREIGIIGKNTAKYMVLGGNPMRNYRRDAASINDQMHRFLQNGLSWLTGRDDLKTSPFKVVVAQMHNNYYFPDEPAVREWLDETYKAHVSYNAAGECDDAKLAGCLSLDTNLLIISRDMNDGSNAENIAAAVKAAMDQGIPVMYLHLDGGMNDLGYALFPLFDVSYSGDNYWRKLQVKQFDVSAQLTSLPDNIQSTQTMLNHFKAEDYAFDWSACDGENCSSVVGLDEQFQRGATAVKSMMNTLDTSKNNLFTKSGYRLQKLLALLGDSYRQQVAFPMDKAATSDTDFLKSYFADHAVYNYRDINPVQADMGNFSRSDFSHITPVSKTVSMTSKRNFRSAGAYALPGQTVSVTRNDSSALTVKVFVNSLRSGSTHQWAEDGYKRPKYLQSQKMQIDSGETISFTSPYGGPLQLEFSQNDLPVELSFANVGEHAYWQSSADDASFTAKLAAADYDWAELVTPGFEVHSTLTKMRESIANESWGSAQALAAGTMRYVHNFPHVLAGFKGPGIDVVDEIHDFATTNNLTIDNLDLVKHMNADQATCGYGCSGNPYDAYWSFSPTGHGDIHELGHGLEKWRLRFNDWQTHTSTNPYSYYTKTQFYKETAGDPSCQSLPFERMFTTLQASVGQTDPAAYMNTELWDKMGWSEGVSLFIQMMMSAEDNGVLVDGWHLLARLHILEREFKRATANETLWAEKKANLGFSEFSLEAADDLNQTDWLLIAVSFATGMDHRDYFAMWGQAYSSAAAAQVAVANYARQAPRNFYISSGTGYCKGEGFDGTKLPVDGNQVWPAT